MTMYELTDDDVRRVVTDMFEPDKITNIRRNKKQDTVSCNIYTTWGSEEPIQIMDKLTLRNPFGYCLGDCIDFDDGNFPVRGTDLKILQQFCYAKGIRPEYLVKDNPYLEENK